MAAQSDHAGYAVKYLNFMFFGRLFRTLRRLRPGFPKVGFLVAWLLKQVAPTVALTTDIESVLVGGCRSVIAVQKWQTKKRDERLAAASADFLATSTRQ